MLIGGVLLAHLGVLSWLRAHLLRHAPAHKAPPSILLGRVAMPAPPPRVEPPPVVADQVQPAAPITTPARRARADSPSITATPRRRTAAPEPVAAPEQPMPSEAADASSMQTDAGDGSTTSSGFQAGGGGVGNQVDLALPPKFNPPPSIAHQAQQRLGLDRSSPTGVSGSGTTATESRGNDGSINARVTTSLGCYHLRIPSPANAAFAMSDLPMHRTTLPTNCP
ncbi:MAG: hypothetical protein LBE78_12795 [Burkholderiaceae bacterium]|nr:hypothetical protein [Burkholderiaceae bacterium]